MKRIIIYLFCLSIALQSMLGQFLLLDHTTGSFGVLTSGISLFSDRTETGQGHVMEVSERDIQDIHENQAPEDVNTGNLKFVRDSIMEHLFSPSNCPNETIHIFTTLSFLYIKNNIDLIVIEEKISNFVHFYASFFRNIQIGLPVAKIIYPFHNFY